MQKTSLLNKNGRLGGPRTARFVGCSLLLFLVVVVVAVTVAVVIVAVVV